jgi:uncharacterized protein (TIGR02147 family)
MEKQARISVFSYTDYRKYLADYYAAQKRKRPDFSYRYFARTAGIVSPGFYKDVVDGRRNLGKHFILKFSRALKLDRKEAEYFENMVNFNQAKTVEDKNLYFERMGAFRNSTVYKVEADKHEFYSTWYFSAVRELLAVGKYTDLDYRLIARSLSPSIRPEYAQKALKVLKKLGFIIKDKNGYLKPVQPTITTGEEIRSLYVANFQRTMMDLAKEAIDLYPAAQRDVSTLTLSVSNKTFKDIKDEIVSFRKKILGMAEKDQDMHGVCQLNLQFFPLSKFKER